MKKKLAEKLQKIATYLEKISKDVNPWAVCTETVGRDDKEKFERCVMDIKKKQGEDEELFSTKSAGKIPGRDLSEWVRDLKKMGAPGGVIDSFKSTWKGVLHGSTKYKDQEAVAAKTAIDTLPKKYLKNVTEVHGPEKSGPRTPKK